MTKATAILFQLCIVVIQIEIFWLMQISVPITEKIISRSNDLPAFERKFRRQDEQGKTIMVTHLVDDYIERDSLLLSITIRLNEDSKMVIYITIAFSLISMILINRVGSKTETASQSKADATGNVT